MCPLSYSRRGFRPAAGRYHEASTTIRPGSPRCAASQAVETSGRGREGSVTRRSDPVSLESGTSRRRAVPPALEKYIARLGRADRSTRLETLLDLAGRLPPLPAELAQAGAREAHRVAACQTPGHPLAPLRDGTAR